MSKIRITISVIILMSFVGINLFTFKSYATEDNVIDNNTTGNEIDNLVNNELDSNSLEDNKLSNNTVNEIENVINNVDNTTNSTNIINEVEQPKVEEKPTIRYKSHVQDYGWQDYVEEGKLSGTTGLSRRLEGMYIKITNNVNCKLKYKVHVQDYGWQDWKNNDQLAGTTGKSKRLEAIQIKLEDSENYSILYRVHVQDYGWQDWKYDGEIAGTTGQSKRLEAIEIKIEEKKVRGTSWIDSPMDVSIIYNKQDINVKGWKMVNTPNSYIKAFIDNNEVAMNDYKEEARKDVINAIQGYGDERQNPKPGYSFKISTIGYTTNEIHTLNIKVYDSKDNVVDEKSKKIRIDNKDMHVVANAHIQNIGWQGDIFENNLVGTTGQSKRMEGIQLKLYNVKEGAKIKYRAHVQNIGWQDWKLNGETAGTTGESKRIEALQIVLENMDDYSVEYCAHVEGKGWQGWKTDGEISGTTGESRRIEAIKIRIVKKYKYSAIDVSYANGDINWQKVKNAGMNNAIIRAGFRGYGVSSDGTDGKLVTDSHFTQNINNALNAGVNVGVYFFTQARTEAEAEQEADYTINLVKNYKITLPIAIDVEWSGKPGNQGRGDLISTEQRTKNIKAFCNRVKAAGYTPLIYLNIDFAKNHVNMSELSEFDVWLANYTTNEKPNYDGPYTMWQYSSTETIDGINGYVDRNRCFKEYKR